MSKPKTSELYDLLIIYQQEGNHFLKIFFNKCIEKIHLLQSLQLINVFSFQL